LLERLANLPQASALAQRIAGELETSPTCGALSTT
jgi:hypothetical protein